ncbi:MAG: glycosyltransferase, partial [Planctomycetaceae bacterium]
MADGMPRRVAMISVHTSPLAVPGSGDAGGMNVYLAQVSRQLAAMGVHVDIFTRRGAPEIPDRQVLADGVQVHNIGGQNLISASKDDLVELLPDFTDGVLQRVDQMAQPRYDAVHAHYWLSGPVAQELAAQWDVPVVASMHTLGAVKNLAHQQPLEPPVRLRVEERLAHEADLLIVN